MAQRLRCTGMGEYGPHTKLVAHIIQRAGDMSHDEAEDLYAAHSTRLLLKVSAAHLEAQARARRAATRSHLHAEFDRARNDAAMTWRRSRPNSPGPWLLVSQAITNAAGALVLSEVLDEQSFHALVDPWRQAIESLTPVRPGPRSRELANTR